MGPDDQTSEALESLLVAAGQEAPTLDEQRAFAAFQVRLVGRADDPVRLGRYAIGRRLGVGGLGIVYEAQDPELDRKVAIKVLHGRGAAALGTHARRRLSKEAQAIASVSHPNVVAVYDVGTHRFDARGDVLPAPMVFIAMELVEGRSLRAWMREDERPWPEVVRVFTAAARGLAAAHDAGLVHRDFKPENVLLGDDGSVKVLDFGLARAVHPTGGDASRTGPSLDVVDPPRLVEASTSWGAMAGTPAYMAPERLRGDDSDARSDQFSFFVALFEALQGQRPFRGSTPRALAEAIEAGPSPAPSGVPPWLAKLIARGLSVDPSHRLHSMAEVVERLQDRSTKRRWMFAGVAAVTVTLGGVSWAATGRDATEACTHSGTLDDVWNAERRRAIGDAMARTELPYADDTWNAAAAELDDWVEAWSEQRAQICAAAHEGDADAGAVLDVRLACLARARTDLDALLEVFETVDASVAERARSAVRRLPGVADCARAEELRGGKPRPNDPALRREIAEVEATLARVKALEHAGRYDEGVDLALEALAASREVDDGPTLVEAQYRVGVMKILAGAAREAAPHLREAYWKAWETGQDRYAAAAAIKLVSLPADSDTVQSWRRYAEAAIERGDLDDSIRGRLHVELGGIALRRGNAQQAAIEFARARELSSGVLGEENAEVGTALNNEAAARFRLGDTDEAITLLRRALQIRRKVLGDHHPHVGTSLTNLATLQIGERRFDAAATSLDDAEALFSSALGADHPKVALVLLSRTVLHLYLGSLPAALADIDRALEISRAAVPRGDASVLRALTLRVTVLLALGRTQDALATAEDAVDVVDRIEVDPRLELGAHEGRARARLAAGKIDAARRDVETALAGSSGLDDDDVAAQAHLTAAKVALAADDIETAASQGAEALRRTDTDDEPGPSGEIELLLAKVEDRRGNPDESRRHAERARMLLEAAQPYYRRHLAELQPLLAR